ncbi:CHASE2 domain-containing protein [Treponema zioleckii]|uniref:CHASE2 domain-containing protein n=1 Tax=Treponema zioleckii TaxID=331680 RepID=UPI00168B15EB|nr:CHASE2 domain-containing protein [Treponema zioleckii]
MGKETKHKSNRFLAKIIVIISIVFWTGIAAVGVLNKFEYRFYDLLLGFRDSPKQRDEVLLVDVDDLALGQMGAWPWTRDIIADALFRMKELGAETVVFDIEYMSESKKAIDENLLQEIQKNPQEKLSDLNNVFLDYDEMFAQNIQFFGNTWMTINSGDIGQSYSEDDKNYASSRFLYSVVDDEDNFEKDGARKTYADFSPANYKFLSHAKGAGYPNVIIDSDGSRRRVRLLIQYDDGCLAQLSTAPLLKIINPSSIERKSRTIVLKDCSIPGESEPKDITIPLDEDGNMLIHWLKKPFITTNPETGELIPEKTSFNHNSVYYLWLLAQFEENIAQNLKDFKDIENFNLTFDSEEDLAFMNQVLQLYDSYLMMKEVKNQLMEMCKGYDATGNAIEGGISDDYYQEFFEMRKRFFEDVTAFVNSNYLISLEKVINNSEGLSEAEIDTLSNLYLNQSAFADSVENYNAYFPLMKETYTGKFCIVGNTGTGTTDLGTTPFNTSYPNVGTHANVYNTILTQDFIKPISWYWSVIFSGILTFILVGFSSQKKAFFQNLSGILLLVIVIVIPVLAMKLFGIYIPSFTSILIAFTSYLVVTITRFMISEKDKKFLQNTFGAYVAPAVVEQIVKNPDVAKLGGKSENLTALFSDVATFSGFTETVNNEELKRTREENETLPPEERKSAEEVNALGASRGAERLVAILNQYLGVLSDAIMDCTGTIDKYVGDEIVSFFGAPVPDENNAFNACVAGIRMLQAEKKFNEEHASELPTIKDKEGNDTGKPFFLHSRVGLNTGSMVVGNMGTDKKLNYTIMGNNVNLASRLEGTNKVYGSWIMVSESTWLEADSGVNHGKLVARAFDAVRVINVKKPVRIYNIIGLREELSEKQITATDIFNEGMKWYMKGADTPLTPKPASDFKKAYEFYKKADELYPEDASSKYFMSRCEDFLANGIPDVWDGVYTMKSK